MPLEFEHFGDSIGEDRIGQHPVGVLAVLEQEREAQHPHARIDAGEEVGRDVNAFDRAKLKSLDHGRLRAELAAWVELDFDLALGGGLDRGLHRGEIVRFRVLGRRRTELHGEVGRLRRGAKPEHKAERKRKARQTA